MRFSPWRVSSHSRKEIDRAGSILRDQEDLKELENLDRYIDAYSVMDAWRASHAFPLNTIQMTLRRRADSLDARSEVVQRLKRAPSVISKLRRFRDMQLSRMQDLGGCRAILSSVDKIGDLRHIYQQSRDRHELATEKDYIATPQESGYRGVHLIYRYNSDRSQDYNGHRIEIQMRTKIQHAWATAVEVAGIYVRTPLKSSIGPEQWLQFFRYSSSAFSIMESSPRLHSRTSESNVIARLKEKDQAIDARRKLRSFTGAHESISKRRRKSDTHFILIMDLSDQRTTIESFSSVTHASSRYAELEKTYINNDRVDVVLVAAESVESVAHAYPNYFADTREFIRLMDIALR